ncbi:hypothetical protein GCM10027340_00480 [Marinomonas epiphytica]
MLVLLPNIRSIAVYLTVFVQKSIKNLGVKSVLMSSKCTVIKKLAYVSKWQNGLHSYLAVKEV